MVTDPIKILGHKDTGTQQEHKKNPFSFIYAFRYLVAGSAVGVLYNVLQMGPAIYLILTRKLLLSYPFELYFDILADQVIGYLLVSIASAAFAVALELRGEHDHFFHGGEVLPSYLKEAEFSAVLALIATLPMIVTSMLSAYVLFKT
ncbi:CASP-like protein 4D1 [Cryptomeria japonica]|uniref:CASP-like protein 4D1 n=1 Tax=Cryptomeria japonica TaxID=3369 RepID=UPI0027D9F1BE|nr:CASP-like protein 4D1 [Cryptomeria japonica]